MKKKAEIAVELKGVTKSYSFHHEKTTLVEKIFSFSKSQEFKALNNVDLTIYKGEKVGIIGRNGSGKTTTLKVISRITTPTKGSVNISGRVVSLIELTAGFHPELSGDENIYLNGLLIGSSREEIDSKYKKIIDFAGIGKFINAPFYTYSEGMKLRLGFSIAIHANLDILVLDEAISTGDEVFQKKSSKKIHEFFKEGKTVIMVSHWLNFLKENCDRFICFEKGEITDDGGEEVVDKYHLNSKKYSRR